MHNKQLFYLVKVMASCKMACRDFAKLRAFLGAKAVGIRATGPETASARGIQRTRIAEIRLLVYGCALCVISS